MSTGNVLRPGNIADNIVEARKITLSRVFSGTFMSSLDGRGFSITLLRANSEMLKYLDAPSNAVGWPSTEGLLSLKREKSSQADRIHAHSEAELQGQQDGAKSRCFQASIDICINIAGSEHRRVQSSSYPSRYDRG